MKRADARTEHEPNDEQPKDEDVFVVAETEGAAEPWPAGSYEQWVESELRAGRDPCIREDDPDARPSNPEKPLDCCKDAAKPI